jgi:MoaA/NifB/PqqE/SkfB family radical SAM enzyme
MAETKSQNHDFIIIDKKPEIISLALTSRCNLRCVMCDHGLREVEKQEFNSELMKNMGDFMSTAELLDLTGLGEPLLSSLFWDILEQNPISKTTTELDFNITFNTNGTLLSDKNIANILKARVRQIRISMDAASDELLYKIRGIKLSDVVTGARKLILKRNSLGRQYPMVGLEMTLMKENLLTVNSMIDISKNIGFDFLDVWSINNLHESMAETWVVNRNGWVFNYKDQLLDTISSADLNQVIVDFYKYGRDHGVPISSMILGKRSVSADFPCKDYFKDPGIKWRSDFIRCVLPWKELRITYEGDVFACCWGPTPIGNLRDSPIQEIWNGPTMQNMRSDLINGKVPLWCVGAACPYLKEAGKQALQSGGFDT